MASTKSIKAGQAKGHIAIFKEVKSNSEQTQSILSIGPTGKMCAHK